MTSATPRSKLFQDLHRLHKHAATLGVLMAAICHFLPERYKLACHMISTICRGH